MRYNELKIETVPERLEWLETLLVSKGYTGLMIDDPADAREILAEPELYRYDYVSEELERDLARNPVVSLFFEDNEDGRLKAAETMSMLYDEAVREEDAAPAQPGVGKSQEGAERVTEHDIDRQEDGCYPEWIRVRLVSAGDDSEWLYKWQEYFKPSRIGSRIVIKPSWEEYQASEGDLVIEMDPGMAFGSGLHETTSMCIKALEKILEMEKAKHAGSLPGEDARGLNIVCSEDDKTPVRVLDVGCGTGILAIAAALLGADECLGIDIDPEAVRVSEENIERNGLSGRVRAQYGDLTEGADYTADIIAANLMADLVMRLTPSAAEHLRDGGWFISSGILDIRLDAVLECLESTGFKIAEVLGDGEWRAVIAAKRKVTES